MELVTHPDVDKVAFTGSTAVGKMIARAVAGTGQEGDARARRQGGEHRLRRRAARPGHRGHHQRHLLQPGRGLLRRIAPLRAGVGLRAAARQAQGPPLDAAGRRSARQEHRCRRHQLGGAAGQGAGARPVAASPRAPRSSSPTASCPTRASSSARRCSPASARAIGSRRRRSSARSCRSSPSARPRRRSRRRTTRRTGCPPGCGRRRAAASSRWSGAMRAGVVWANTFNRFDPTSPVRRLQGVRLRARGRHPRPGRLPRPVAERHERPMIDTARLSRDPLDVVADGWTRPGSRSTIATANDAMRAAWRASRAASRGITTPRTSSSCAGAAPSASSSTAVAAGAPGVGRALRGAARPAPPAGGRCRPGLRPAAGAAGDEAVRRGGGLMATRAKTATRSRPRLGPRSAAPPSRWPRPTAPAPPASGIERPQDLQALYRRRIPAHRVGPRLRGLRRARASCWPTPAAARARTSATRCGQRARRSRTGRRGPPSTAARSCTASPS